MGSFKSIRSAKATLLVAGLALGLSATAYANEIQVPYNVPAGGTSAPINVPGVNTPVSMTCVQNTVGFRGVGMATVLRVNPPAFLEWIGFDIASAGAPSTGFTATAGTHMIYCDFSKTVDLQTQSATAIQIKNTNGTAMTGIINFVW